jgi:hypothetical protein
MSGTRGQEHHPRSRRSCRPRHPRRRDRSGRRPASLATSSVLEITRDAFTAGFHIAAITAGGIVAILAVVTVAVLRRTQSDSAAADTGSG